jgi:hypothetical protein
VCYTRQPMKQCIIWFVVIVAALVVADRLVKYLDRQRDHLEAERSKDRPQIGFAPVQSLPAPA